MAAAISSCTVLFFKTKHFEACMNPGELFILFVSVMWKTIIISTRLLPCEA